VTALAQEEKRPRASSRLLLGPSAAKLQADLR